MTAYDLNVIEQDLSSNKLRHNVRPIIMKDSGKNSVMSREFQDIMTHPTQRGKQEKRNNKPQLKKWVPISSTYSRDPGQDLQPWLRSYRRWFKHMPQQAAQFMQHTGTDEQLKHDGQHLMLQVLMTRRTHRYATMWIFAKSEGCTRCFLIKFGAEGHDVILFQFKNGDSRRKDFTMTHTQQINSLCSQEGLTGHNTMITIRCYTLASYSLLASLA